jgi:hypothetical protein
VVEFYYVCFRRAATWVIMQADNPLCSQAAFTLPATLKEPEG